MGTVTTATRKLLILRAEDAVSLHSDLFKDLNGFRPRYWTSGDIAANPMMVLRNAEACIKCVSADLSRVLERERTEREAFNAKVSALGLEPSKYSRLFEYADE